MYGVLCGRSNIGYTALPTPVGDACIAGPVIDEHLDVPPGESAGIDLIPETTQQGEGAKERTGSFVHGLVRYALRLLPCWRLCSLILS